MVEVYLGRQVSFPGLYVVRVHGQLLEVVGILIAQTGKAVAKLVYHHGAKLRMVGHGQVV